MKIFSDEDFDPVFYTSFYPDLRHLGRWRAAAHWKRHGKSEGRWPCEAAALAALRAHPDLPRDFNPQQYLHLNQDVADAIGTEAGAMKHYLDHGRHENRRFRVFSPALRLFKAGDTTACAAQKTVIVGGTMRGGTSMVAGAVMGLGVHMGTSLDVNVEDPAFNIHRSDCEDRQEFVETLKQEIAKRNARHDVWGWKFPGVASYLEEVVDLLRAPRLVFVFRDPVAIAHRKVRPGSKANNTKLALENMAGNLKTQMANLACIDRLKIPSLIVSHERAVADPEGLLADLSGFIGQPVPADASKILDFMRPGSYKSVDTLRV